MSWWESLDVKYLFFGKHPKKFADQSHHLYKVFKFERKDWPRLWRAMRSNQIRHPGPSSLPLRVTVTRRKWPKRWQWPRRQWPRRRRLLRHASRWADCSTRMCRASKTAWSTQSWKGGTGWRPADWCHMGCVTGSSVCLHPCRWRARPLRRQRCLELEWWRATKAKAIVFHALLDAVTFWDKQGFVEVEEDAEVEAYGAAHLSLHWWFQERTDNTRMVRILEQPP